MGPARWFARLTDEAGPGTQRRTNSLGAAAMLLGYPHERRPAEAEALWRLAFAGWCWREVERGDRFALREAARSAYVLRASPNRSPLERLVDAAWDLSGEAERLAAGSPGRSQHQRASFLARGFASLPDGLRAPRRIDVEQCSRAFRYGIALHDAERLAPLDV